MHIASLAITDLRVVKELELTPGPGVNFITGNNGAGKTSILEAIYLAGRGRTFRHKDAGPLIRRGADSATVVVGIRYYQDNERQSTLGIRRERRQVTCRLDGEDIKKRSVLAETLPVQWIGSQPQLFLSMGPEIRRRFIDMGLFHVEQSYLKIIGEFQRTLRQRNAAIRMGDGKAVRIWDQPFSLAAETLNTRREAFVRRLMDVVSDEFNAVGTDISLSYRYKRGWTPEIDLTSVLESNLDLDLRMGYTTRGPQRADLELYADGDTAEKILSRGQQKILVLGLNLALSEIICAHKGTAPILLIDDLAAELDHANRKRIVGELERRSGQVFLTKIEDGALQAVSSSARTFHVEHGTIK